MASDSSFITMQGARRCAEQWATWLRVDDGRFVEELARVLVRVAPIDQFILRAVSLKSCPACPQRFGPSPAIEAILKVLGITVDPKWEAPLATNLVREATHLVLYRQHPPHIEAWEEIYREPT